MFGTGMHDFQPHSFDTRGFLLSIAGLVVLVGLVAAGRYGVVIASEHMTHESQVAAAEMAAADAQRAELHEKHAAAKAEQNKPSLFIVEKAPPKIAARSFILADMDSDVVFAQKNGTTIFPIASITKLLTALVAKEELAASTTISITESDRRASQGTPGSITRDESFSLADSLYPLLTESNNSVAYALARAAGTEEFMRAMRAKAAEIGMTLTTLADPSGISEHNAASALDIYLLTRHLYAEAPDFLAMTRATDMHIAATSGRTYSFSNFNVFSGRDQFVGGKTGYTDEARQTMTTVFKVPIENSTATATIGIIVLGSDDRKRDTEALLRWFTSAAQLATTTPAN